MIAEMLRKVALEFIYEIGKPFAGNELAEFIRRDLRDAGRNLVTFREEDYLVKGSAGAGNWASVPWLGFFDPLVTDTAQKGFYVVFLLNPDTQDFYLSLNQGTTQIHKEFGGRAYLEVLKRRAADIRLRLADIRHEFSDHPISLGSADTLPAGYEAGHALGRKFTLEELRDGEIERSLGKILDLYQVLISRGGITPSDIMAEEASSTDVEECRRYVLSKRIERSPRVRQQVLAKHSLRCDTCGLDPQIDYSYQGKLESIPLDVHHLAPLKDLSEGEAKRYRIPDDFAVLCPNCHRAAHQLQDPSDMEALKALIRFKYMREIL